MAGPRGTAISASESIGEAMLMWDSTASKQIVNQPSPCPGAEEHFQRLDCQALVRLFSGLEATPG
jgi:hypothetical protein